MVKPENKNSEYNITFNINPNHKIIDLTIKKKNNPLNVSFELFFAGIMEGVVFAEFGSMERSI